MKKGLKLVPFALAALMLVGCSSKPIGPVQGDNPIVNDTTISYQEYYDQMFEEYKGSERAAKELILKVAKDTVNKSETFKAYGIEKLVNERKNKVLDGFYTSTYKKNGYFQEELLVQDLQNQGYNITLKEGKQAFEEDFDNLLGYGKLHEKLGYDYSDYLTKNSEYDIYVQLLKEEYILSQKASYFKDKRIRKVQYFKYTNDVPSNAEKIQQTIEESLTKHLNENKGVFTEDSFKALAQETFQMAVNEKGLEKAAKDFAIINDNPVTEFEKELKKDKFKLDKYLTDVNSLNESEQKEVETAYNSYTNNGAYAKEFGYDLKKIEVLNTLGYGEGFLSSDDNSTTVVNSEVDTLIKKDKLEDSIITHKVDGKDVKTSLLDATGAGSKVFKKENTYYVVRVEIINEETKEAKDKISGANTLTRNTTNVKNAVAYYLEQAKVDIHEETLYNYLKDTFGFDKEKK